MRFPLFLVQPREEEEKAMKHQHIQEQFRCGAIEASFENSRWVSAFFQVVFTLIGMYFFWLMIHEQQLVEKIDNIAVLFFCLWRIHRQRDTVCYITEKGLVVRRQFMSLHEFLEEQVHADKHLVFLAYKDIFYIADSWQEIELGHAEEGGIAVLPVHLQFLSKKNKQQIMDRLKKEQEKQDTAI